MKRVFLKVIALVCCLITLLSIGFGCKKKGESVKESEKESVEPLIIPDGYTQLTIGSSNGVKTEGYGAQIDTHIYKAYKNMNE